MKKSIIKERLGLLSYIDKECAIIALAYLSDVTGKKYTYDIEKNGDFFSLTINFEVETDINFFYRFYGAAEQFYKGNWTYHFIKFAINEKAK
jgi:hypothetical protein